jgi:hypothetical protein
MSDQPIDHAAALQFLAYDHRGSIVGYLHDQATSFEVKGHKDVADVLRAQASNISIQMDIRQGVQGIASPVDAIVMEVCGAFGGTKHSEVVNMSHQTKAVSRVRAAAMWVASKRLKYWSDGQLAAAFRASDRSTVIKAVRRAEQLRADDHEFRRITDNLVERPVLRCEHCQHALEPIT